MQTHTQTLIHTCIHTNKHAQTHTHTYKHRNTRPLHISPFFSLVISPISLTVLIGGTHTGLGHFEVGNVSFDYWFT